MMPAKKIRSPQSTLYLPRLAVSYAQELLPAHGCRMFLSLLSANRTNAPKDLSCKILSYKILSRKTQSKKITQSEKIPCKILSCNTLSYKLPCNTLS